MLEHVNIALKTGGPVFCNAGRRSWVDTNFHGESPRRNGKEGDGRGGNEVQVHVSANRLTMRDMGGTHITYLSFMLISIVFCCWELRRPKGASSSSRFCIDNPRCWRCSSPRYSICPEP